MHWYAIYTKPRAEKRVFERLVDKEIETFLPLINKVRIWKDRKKKIEMPLFPGYLFVKFDYKNRFDILQTDGIVKIINFSGVPAVVPDWQIDSLRKLLDHPETLQLENAMRPDDLVEVTEGPFKGVKGCVKTVKDVSRLVITIDGLQQSVSIEIDTVFLKKIEKTAAEI